MGPERGFQHGCRTSGLEIDDGWFISTQASRFFSVLHRKLQLFQIFRCFHHQSWFYLGDVPPTGGGPPPSGVTPGREGQGFGIRPKGAEVRSGHLEKLREPGKSPPFFELFNGDIPIQTSIDRGFSIAVFLIVNGFPLSCSTTRIPEGSPASTLRANVHGMSICFHYFDHSWSMIHLGVPFVCPRFPRRGARKRLQGPLVSGIKSMGYL